MYYRKNVVIIAQVYHNYLSQSRGVYYTRELISMPVFQKS